MKTGDLARLFGVSITTIQNWINEFGDHLSDPAKKIGAKQRSFNEDDVLVLATVASLSADGLNYDTIRKRLADGERVEHPGVANYGVDTRMIPTAAVEQLIDATELKIELEQIKAERDKLLSMLERSEDEKTALRAKVDELQAEMANLRERLGRAEGRLEEKDKRRRGWFGGNG
ncbi:MAG: MerR family transcriptional regulator [Anaerolineales bacterium]